MSMVRLSVVCAAVAFALPARAGMVPPRSLARTFTESQAVVLGTVVAANATEADGARTVALDVVIIDAIPGGALRGGQRVAVTVVQTGLATSADFGTSYKVGVTYLFALKQGAIEGSWTQLLFVAPHLVDKKLRPEAPHPRTVGERWFAIADWSFGGLAFPPELPLTFAEDSGKRVCQGDTLNDFTAWFTWEDLRAVPWSSIDPARAQATWSLPCDVTAPIPLAIKCSKCPPVHWRALQAIECEMEDDSVVMERVKGADFKVTAALSPSARKIPAAVKAVEHKADRTLRFVGGNASAPPYLILSAPDVEVLSMEVRQGVAPSPPPLPPTLYAELPQKAPDVIRMRCSVKLAPAK